MTGLSRTCDHQARDCSCLFSSFLRFSSLPLHQCHKSLLSYHISRYQQLNWCIHTVSFESVVFLCSIPLLPSLFLSFTSTRLQFQDGDQYIRICIFIVVVVVVVIIINDKYSRYQRHPSHCKCCYPIQFSLHSCIITIIIIIKLLISILLISFCQISVISRPIEICSEGHPRQIIHSSEWFSITVISVILIIWHSIIIVTTSLITSTYGFREQ